MVRVKWCNLLCKLFHYKDERQNGVIILKIKFLIKKEREKAKKTEKGGDDEPEEDEDRHAEPGGGCCSCTMLQLNG